MCARTWNPFSSSCVSALTAIDHPFSQSLPPPAGGSEERFHETGSGLPVRHQGGVIRVKTLSVGRVKDGKKRHCGRRRALSAALRRERAARLLALWRSRLRLHVLRVPIVRGGALGAALMPMAEALAHRAARGGWGHRGASGGPSPALRLPSALSRDRQCGAAQPPRRETREWFLGIRAGRSPDGCFTRSRHVYRAPGNGVDSK